MRGTIGGRRVLSPLCHTLHDGFCWIKLDNDVMRPSVRYSLFLLKRLHLFEIYYSTLSVSTVLSKIELKVVATTIGIFC